MARKKHQYFWVIETFSTDSTSPLTRWLERSEKPVGVQGLVICLLPWWVIDSSLYSQLQVLS